MGFNYRKSIKIIPGVKINISKSGVSTSIGGKGYTANISKRGVKHTISAPGTGLSFSKTYKSTTKASHVYLESDADEDVKYIDSISSFNLPSDSTSDDLWDLKVSVVDSASETKPLVSQLSLAKSELVRHQKNANGLISKLFKGYKKNNEDRCMEASNSIKNISDKILQEIIYIDFENERTELLESVLESAKNLWKSEGAWDNTNYIETEGILSKRKVDLSDIKEPFNLKTKSTSGPLFSISGNTLYLYPEFIHFGNENGNDNYISIKNLNIGSFDLDSPSNGDEYKYSDLDKAKPVWLFRKKDGGADFRYKDNKKVPAAYYTYVYITDDEDFDISIILTNRKFAKDFVVKMKALIKSF